MNGNGSKRRPENQDRYSDNYRKIFSAQVKYVPVRKLKREVRYV